MTEMGKPGGYPHQKEWRGTTLGEQLPTVSTILGFTFFVIFIEFRHIYPLKEPLQGAYTGLNE